MIRINQLKLSPEHTGQQLHNKIKRALNLSGTEAFTYEIAKCSIDARKKPDIYLSYTIDVSIDKENTVIKKSKNKQAVIVQDINYCFPGQGNGELKHRPVIIGTGPAGLFCGYMLAKNGYRPVLIERGQDVDHRLTEVETFWKTGKLNTDSNVQFGEGGAGTFSDGKLNTLVKDKEGRNKEVLSILVKAGAPASVLYDAKPHIGTDILMQIVKNMRNAIIENGGSVLFETKMTELDISKGRLQAIYTETKNGKKEKMETDLAVLAIGHSARDTFQMLYESKIPMEAKSFAVGLRTEHEQSMIDLSQYGIERSDKLPPASYKLTAQTRGGRGVYSFCMCPGGYVVNASSEEGRLAVNGMSYSGRDGKNANSAIIVSVMPKDYKSSHPLAGVEFQRMLEEKAYALAKGKIPVEYYGDFKVYTENAGIAKEKDMVQCGYLPQIKGIWEFANVHEIMPEELNLAFIEGMEHFDKLLPGFAADKTLLSGIESRTSSPVRIHRDENGECKIKGIYPCGEGAGYAGGITSAAMDGMKIAEQIAKHYKGIKDET